MMGIPILQLIPFHPLSNHVRHDCHGLCCRYGSYFAVASLVLEPADCQADMHELAYRVMCMPWVKRTEHVGV